MALIITVKAVPASGRSKILLDKSGMIKCFLKSQAENGNANKELISLFAKSLDLIQNQIFIVSGLTSPKKILRIEANLNQEQLYIKLGLVIQNKIS